MRRVFFLLLLTSLLLTSCQSPSEHVVSDYLEQNRQVKTEEVLLSPTDQMKDQPLVFYNLYASQNRYWYYPETFLSTGEDTLVLQAVNKTLAAICQSLGLEEFSVESIQHKNKIAEIDLAGKFTELLPPLNAVRTVGEALVMTLTEFAEIERAQFFIDGQTGNFLSRNSAQFEINLPVSRPTWPNEESPRPEQKTVFYWALPKSDRLVPITLPLVLGETVEKQALKVLISGPDSYLNGFSPSVKLPLDFDYSQLQIYKEEERVYINFPFEPADWPEEDLLLSLRAIVQTLTEIENVESVQFLFLGKKHNVFYENFNLGLAIEKLPLLNPNN
ncbi:MAG: hypothetical protein GX138_07075 [Firmicutes bacterium]|jgi:spore germination protein GerM|nr:hypothetical protein [Bacillota bacterium]